MNLNRQVVVLHGAVAADAPPDEQDVLAQAQAVAQALERLGYAAEALPLTLDLAAARDRLAARRPQLVFNLVEAVAGSGRLLPLGPALLEELGLPYTGVPLAGLYLTCSKLAVKQLLALAGIPTPPLLDQNAETGGEDGLWIVKSVWEHASIGLDDAALVPARGVDAALAQRRGRWGGDWFAERYIDGREFNLALLAGPDGPEVLPAAEIVFRDFPPDMPRIVGYAAKWDSDSFACRHTVRTFPGGADRPLLAAMQELALRCWRLFGLAGYARVDFRVDAAGRPWVLEVNANPCLSPDAGFMASADRAGYGFDDVVRRLVEDAKGFSA